MMAPRVAFTETLAADQTGAPGNALRVTPAAKSGDGRSSAMSVRVIFAGLGASRGIKSKRVGADAKAGRECCLGGQPGAVDSRKETEDSCWARDRSGRAQAWSEAEFLRGCVCAGASAQKLFWQRVQIIMEMSGASTLSIICFIANVSAFSCQHILFRGSAARLIRNDVAEITAKAKVLLEALPYIQDFSRNRLRREIRRKSFMDDPDP